MKRFIFAIVVLFWGASAGASTGTSMGTGHFIGNGGEGFEFPDGTFVFRDLFEAGAHRTAVVGADADPVIAERLEALSASFRSLGVPSSLLARKLTDLNRMSPFLGLYVIEAWSKYEWLFVDETLGITADDAPLIELPPGARRRTIANRSLNTIHLQRRFWGLLDDVSRTALLIHEGLFSLVPPACDAAATLCRQSGQRVREAVGWLFSAATVGRPLPETLRASFWLPQRASQCDHLPPAVRVHFWRKDRNGKPKDLLRTIEEASPLDLKSRATWIEKVCRARETAREQAMEIELRRWPYIAHVIPFLVDGSEQQVAIQLIDRPPRMSEFFEIGYFGEAVCRTSLGIRLRSFFDVDGVYDRSGGSACQLAP